jgi:acetoin utilization deacetylase AcuC-like enzyme
MSKKGIIFDQYFLGHYVKGCPEKPERIKVLLNDERILNLANSCVQIKPHPIDMEILRWTHCPSYLSDLNYLVGIAKKENEIQYFDSDTGLVFDSMNVLRNAAGALIEMADLIALGRLDNGFGIIRPGGHHATYNEAMGFCYINHAAVIANYFLRNGVFERILILDWDVHHGNGTQDLFYDNDQVLFISLQQFPSWPKTGKAKEIGSANGLGYNMNIPIPAGMGKDAYFLAFHELVIPIVDRYKPEFIIVSAGFDAHWDDPLSYMNLEAQDFSDMTKIIMDLASKHSNGKSMFFMEGGYSLDALQKCVHSTLATLLGKEDLVEKEEMPYYVEISISDVIQALKKIHKLG